MGYLIIPQEKEKYGKTYFTSARKTPIKREKNFSSQELADLEVNKQPNEAKKTIKDLKDKIRTSLFKHTQTTL